MNEYSKTSGRKQNVILEKKLYMSSALEHSSRSTRRLWSNPSSPSAKSDSFAVCKWISLHPPLPRSNREKLESPLTTMPTDCNPDNLQPWKYSNYGENVLDTIRSRSIEFEHLNRVE